MTTHDRCYHCVHVDKDMDDMPCKLCKGTADDTTAEYEIRHDYFARRGTTLETIMLHNIEKLKKRYPDGFDKARSVNRAE